MAPVPKKFFVRPAMGKGKMEGKALIIRDPISMRPLKEEGEEKTRNPYWMRRVRCGDCLTDKLKSQTVAKKSNPNQKAQTADKPKEGKDQ